MTNSTGAGSGLATLRAAFVAGATSGFVLGLADGLNAGSRTATEGALNWCGALAAAAFVYGALGVAAAALLALVGRSRLRERTARERVEALAWPVLGAGLAAELYWWTREFLFYGLPASDPKRLSVAAVLVVVGLAAGFALVRASRRVPEVLRRASLAAVAASWIGGAAFLALSARGASELGRVNERTEKRPNVLLFVCDAMRADVLGCYGNERVRTPTIDSLAAEGVLFENAFVQAPFTGSSFGSFFTGKYPRRHGFVKMAADTRMAPNITLASHLKTAPLNEGGRLEPADYHCVTFMTGALSQASGLARGFDSYFEAFMGHDLVDVESPWSVFSSELVLYIFRAKLLQKLDDAPVASRAARWFRENPRKRFFAMVHLFGTHTPYDPPRDLRELYCDPTYDGPVKTFRSDHAHAIHQGLAKPTEADVKQITNLYHGGVSQNDREIAQVIAALEEIGALDDTLVIVTADHGEELGEHGVWEHNHMFQSNLRVPLVMRWPQKLPRSRRVGALVESIDLLPTLCDLIGLEPPLEERFDAQGRNYGALDGLSVLPLIDGPVTRVREFSFAENGLEMAVQSPAWKLVVPCVDAQARPLALASESLDSLLARPSGRPRLYDLEQDPGEATNVIEKERERAEELRAVLASWDASMPIPRVDVVLSDRDREEAARRLKELGYADGVGQDVKPVHRD